MANRFDGMSREWLIAQIDFLEECLIKTREEAEDYRDVMYRRTGVCDRCFSWEEDND